jgi:hypothetical protein
VIRGRHAQRGGECRHDDRVHARDQAPQHP